MIGRASRRLSVAVILGVLLPGGGGLAAAQAPGGVRKGPENAPFQLTLVCSIESDSCASLVLLVGRLLEEQPERVSASFRHMAPAEHGRSPVAYRVALAAARQGKGWEVLDTLFANRATLEETSLEGLAGVHALDRARLQADLGDAALADLLDREAAEAARLGVTSVPALFVNGRRLENVSTYNAIVGALK